MYDEKRITDNFGFEDEDIIDSDLDDDSESVHSTDSFEEPEDVHLNNASLESSYILKWQKEIDLHITLDTTIILEGNVNDKQIYVNNDGIIDITSTENWLYSYLHDIGYNTVIFFNNVDGFYSNKRTKAEYDRFFKLVKKGEKVSDYTGDDLIDNPASMFGSALADIRSAMKNTSEPVAIIMTGASRYIPNPSTISESDHFFYSKLSLATKSIVKSDKSHLHNILFLIAEKVNDIPAWFYLNNPLVKTITIPVPDLNVRKMYIDSYYDDFEEESDNDIEKSKDSFVAYTDGFKIVDLDSLRTLMIKEKIPVSKVASGVSKFKYGVDENPWEDDRLKKELNNLEDKLKERVKGQDSAVRKAANIIKSAVLGLAGLQHSSSKSKPRGIMFLAGPTGVGKTELAKSISEWLFKTDSSVIRFDMSEYSQSHTDQRLLGAPPGYVGYEQGGQLTEAIKKNPFSVLLFDEIEKAHPSILDKFLQILEDGRMTDGKGETVYFSDALIIFTSNLGMYREERYEYGFVKKIPTVSYGEDGCNEADDAKQLELYNNYSSKILEEITKFFTLKIERPEIKNRIGENFIVFDFISYKAAEEIAKKQIKTIVDNLKKTKDINLCLSEQAYDSIFNELKKDEHISQGGRGVGNIIENMLIRPLSNYLVEHELFGECSLTINDIKQNKGNFEVICD